MKFFFLLISTLIICQDLLSQTIESYIENGNNKYKSMEFKGAIEDYTKAIKINPKNAKVYLFRANAKGQAHNYEGAIADYDKSIKLNPELATSEFYISRGYSNSILRNTEAAIDDYTKAIELDPNNFKAFHLRGMDKIYLYSINSGCLDLKEALRLGDAEASRLIEQFCH